MPSRFSSQTLDETVQRELSRMAQRRKSYTTALFTTDHHFPYYDDNMKKVELAYLKEEKPDYHVLGGDWVDASGLSDFSPNAKFIDETQNEIDGFVKYLAELHAASPKTKRIMIYGNHDQARLDRAASEKPFGFAGLRVLNFKKLFQEAAQVYGVEVGDLEFHYEWMLGPGLKFLHGDERMDKKLKGGVTGARRTASEYPGDYHLVMGHKHRKSVGRHSWRDREVHYVPGMLDVTKVSYPTHAKYENGLAVIHYNPMVRPQPTYFIHNMVAAPNGTMIIDGKEYNPNRRHRK